MVRFSCFVLLIVAQILFGVAMVGAQETYTMHGVINDASGNPVTGAEVSVYRTNNVKKPASFASGKTGLDGKYKIILPQGSYWTVAALRKSGKSFGPLGLGDKYSGEAVEVSAGPDEEMRRNFVVMDLREAARQSQKKNIDLLEVRGKIIDNKGRPQKLAYAMAATAPKIKGVPKILSAWTDQSGEYVLFLPKGKYFFGATTGFPPNSAYIFPEMVFELDNDKSGFDLVVSSN